MKGAALEAHRSSCQDPHISCASEGEPGVILFLCVIVVLFQTHIYIIRHQRRTVLDGNVTRLILLVVIILLVIESGSRRYCRRVVRAIIP